MSLKEKVISGLEHCTQYGHCGDECPSCVYYEECSTDGEPLLRDVLTLMRPRVMSKEEVRGAVHKPLWFESKGTFRGVNGFWCLHSGIDITDHIRLLCAVGGDSTELSLKDYGTVWRCWTLFPSDEQRKKAKWMPENDKIIKRLEKTIECAEWANKTYINCDIDFLKQIPALLEKQEPVKPRRNYQCLSDYWCECGWHLGKSGSVKYCPDCGRMIDWE